MKHISEELAYKIGTLALDFTYPEKFSDHYRGSVVLQGSMDGTNFVTIGSAFTVTNVASQSTFFLVTKAANAYIYFKVLDTGSGTGVRVTSANWLVRK